MESKLILERLDYSEMVNSINFIISRDEHIKSELLKIPSSIIVGRQYTSKYLTKINKMLSTEFVNTEILDELKREIKTDLKVIQADTALRGYVPNARENEKTMLLISNFIISL